MSPTAASATDDDRSTPARIRGAAIAVIAEHGPAATTARLVATAAGVSPGSVIHHFGSMDDLRQPCDEHVAAVVRERKHAAIAQVLGPLGEGILTDDFARTARAAFEDTGADGTNTSEEGDPDDR